MPRFAVAAPLLALLLSASPLAAKARAAIGSDAAACDANDGPAILATISGLKDRKGRLKLELYPATANDFLRDDRDLINEGKVFRRVWADTPAAGPVEICIRVPRAGSYGLFFTHDRDGKNKFNFWSDGAGITSNARIGASKPKIGASTVEVGSGITTVTIKAQYLRGLSGLSPLKQ